MATLNIALYEIMNQPELDDFTDIVQSMQFKYNTAHLSLAGLDHDDITTAVTRAMRVCRLNGIETREHFRSLYVFDKLHGGTYCDWRMTREGFMLAIMNAPTLNESLANCQWEIIHKING